MPCLFCWQLCVYYLQLSCATDLSSIQQLDSLHCPSLWSSVVSVCWEMSLNERSVWATPETRRWRHCTWSISNFYYSLCLLKLHLWLLAWSVGFVIPFNYTNSDCCTFQVVWSVIVFTELTIVSVRPHLASQLWIAALFCRSFPICYVWSLLVSLSHRNSACILTNIAPANQHIWCHQPSSW